MLICALSNSGLRAFNAVNRLARKSNLNHPKVIDQISKEEKQMALEGKLPEWIPSSFGIDLTGIFSNNKQRVFTCLINTLTGVTKEIAEIFHDEEQQLLSTEELTHTVLNSESLTFHQYLESQFSFFAEQTAKTERIEY